MKKLSLRRILKEINDADVQGDGTNPYADTTMALLGYHGTTQEMEKPEEFFAKKLNFGPGFYFATHPEGSLTYGDVVYEVDAAIYNPIIFGLNDENPKVENAIMDALNISEDFIEPGEHRLYQIFQLTNSLIDAGVLSPQKFKKILLDLDYDGVYVRNDVLKATGTSSPHYKGDYFALFKPNRILRWRKLDPRSLEYAKEEYRSWAEKDRRASAERRRAEKMQRQEKAPQQQPSNEKPSDDLDDFLNMFR